MRCGPLVSHNYFHSNINNFMWPIDAQYFCLRNKIDRVGTVYMILRSEIDRLGTILKCLRNKIDCVWMILKGHLQYIAQKIERRGPGLWPHKSYSHSP